MCVDIGYPLHSAGFIPGVQPSIDELLPEGPRLPQLRIADRQYSNSSIPSDTLSVFLSKRYALARNCVSPYARQRCLSLIKSNLHHQDPLRLIIGIGCYKPAGLAGAPRCAWAEYLHMRHMLALAKDIGNVYPLPIYLKYVLLDIFTTEITGIDPAAVYQYAISFEYLIEALQSRLDSNVSLGIVRLSQLVDPNRFLTSVNEYLPQVHLSWGLPEQQDAKAAELKKAARNRLHTGRDSEIEVEHAAKLHMAYLQALNDIDMFRHPSHLPILLRRPNSDLNDWLPLKSYHNSAIQPWVGEGCLIKTKNRAYLTIIGRRELVSGEKLGCLWLKSPPTVDEVFSRISVYQR